MPRSRRRLNSPAASAEPVEPPDTKRLRPTVGDRAGRLDDRRLGRRADRVRGIGLLGDRDRARRRPRRPAGTAPISAAGPNSRTRIPSAAARAAPAATSRGPRSAPPASTATVTTRALSGDRLVPIRNDDLAALVAAAHGADAVGKPRAVALRARVVGRRVDLVLRTALRGPRVGLLLLGDGHGGQCSRRGSAIRCTGCAGAVATRTAAPTARPSADRARARGGDRDRPRSGSTPHTGHRPAQSARHRMFAGTLSASASRAHACRSSTPSSTYGETRSSLVGLRVWPTTCGGARRWARASFGCETSRASTVNVGAAGSRQRMHGPTSEASNRSRSA